MDHATLAEMHPHQVTAARAEVVAQALSWRGTPYHHHGRIKGVGVDCAHLLIAVYAAAGVVAEFDPGFYPTDWHLHQREELFRHWLLKLGAVQVPQPAVGDVALYRFGRCFSHGAIVVAPGMVVHAYLPRSGGAGQVALCRMSEQPLASQQVQYWSPWA